ncbi:hypothetical protein GWI33_003880 [Rhynchophorus ferrugineus]|uniref:Enoyl-[acyl-carrier-protein] reductase, mitochondrial n=1 Tax=Rhynchophorus ferrugineus TaxID=354439 RepID=A0A834IZC3_RHYFE|nr:hypothetical protein GWI33_003880 [Rhynchophorus ferrugineus]
MSKLCKTFVVVNRFMKQNHLVPTYQTRMNSTATKLFYTDYGDPMKVINKQNEEVRKPNENEVLVKMIAAAVNPADINTIQGKYPSKPTLPAVPGNEGVGKIVKVGSNVKEFVEGDHVVPLTPNLGTWQTHLIAAKDQIYKVPKKLGIVEAATFTVNPCTAYRMLRDFARLKPGDTVIQNGANSACGQNVIQLCANWGFKTVNIVRDRPDIDELRNYLTKLGATYVLTEDELRITDIFKSGQIDKPKLALNCVGGKNALECSRHLQNGGSMVTYGGMSREPLNIPTSALIFKDLQFRGFWMTRWSKENATSIDRFEMFEELITMMINDDLHAPAFEFVNFDNYKEALLNTLTIKGMIGKKYILKFE